MSAASHVRDSILAAWDNQSRDEAGCAVVYSDQVYVCSLPFDPYSVQVLVVSVGVWVASGPKLDKKGCCEPEPSLTKRVALKTRLVVDKISLR